MPEDYTREYKENDIARGMFARSPRGSLEEKDTEIARLQARVARLEEVAKWARVYLTNSTPANAVHLNEVLRAEEEEQG